MRVHELYKTIEIQLTLLLVLRDYPTVARIETNSFFFRVRSLVSNLPFHR